MPIDVPLSVLVVDDSPADAAQIGVELARGGYTPRIEVVTTADGMAEALARQRWDLICTEYHLVKFSGLRALLTVQRVVTAIQAAARGENYFSPTVATRVFQHYQQLLHQPEAKSGETLTEREREILQLIAEGNTNREIAEMLTLSIKTVQAHRSNMMDKLGAHDRTDLVKYAIRVGMISAEE